MLQHIPGGSREEDGASLASVWQSAVQGGGRTGLCSFEKMGEEIHLFKEPRRGRRIRRGQHQARRDWEEVVQAEPNWNWSDRGLASDGRDIAAGNAEVRELARVQAGKLTVGLLILAIGAELVDNGVQHLVRSICSEWLGFAVWFGAALLSTP